MHSYSKSVTFGFHTPECIVEISGVNISNPETLNSLNKPTLGGYLYDPVMGWGDVNRQDANKAMIMGGTVSKERLKCFFMFFKKHTIEKLLYWLATLYHNGQRLLPSTVRVCDSLFTVLVSESNGHMQFVVAITHTSYSFPPLS